MQIPLVDLRANYLSIKKDIDQAIQKNIANQAFIMGSEVAEFEEVFANFNESKFAISVANGTEGIHLALQAIDIKAGDEIITCPTTFIATIEPIFYLGAKAIFVDCEGKTGNIDAKKIEKAITKKTKAIILVHLNGHPCEMNPIMKIVYKYKLKLIEDCSHAHGSSYNGKKVGNFGDIGVFSLFPAKILGAYGDAGIMVTNDMKLMESLKLLRDHGRLSKYEHKIICYNCRLDTLQAAILLAKMPHLKKWIKRRKDISSYYSKHLNSCVSIPPQFQIGEQAFYMYVIRTPNRDGLKEYLAKKGISTVIHYPTPLHLQPACKMLGYKKGSFPNAERYSDTILSLPLYPELKNEQLDFVIDAIKKFFALSDKL